MSGTQPVNRKQRRANSKSQPPETRPLADLFARAAQSHREGRLEEAGQLYRQVLAGDPHHSDSLHRLGVIAYQKGRFAEAEALLGKAIMQNAKVAAYHSHLGLALDAQGRLDEALVCCGAAIAQDPSLADVHNNMGVLLTRLGRCEEALASYRRAIALVPGLPEIHNNLGNALLALDHVGEAAESYRKAVVLAPGFADAHANLGGVLQALGQADEAIAHFRRALEIDPGGAEILASLALAYLAQGDQHAAMEAVIRSLTLRETAQARRAFVQCVRDLQVQGDAGPLPALLLRALREGWDRPDDLAPVCAAAILRSPGIAALMARTASGSALLDGDGLAALAENRLLEALLCCTPNLDIDLERLLTAARRHLLCEVSARPEANAMLDFHAALARQCFINEYVFLFGDEELAQARALRDALAAALEKGEPVPPSWVAAVATYFPLASVSLRLTERTWPGAIAALLVQQIQEPQEERQLRTEIPRLTAISDSVSCLVQAQYEENPYPRWVVAGSSQPPEELVSHLRRKFPHAAIQTGVAGASTEILLAGCGTGRNAIETAQRFTNARLLAVDLSLNSLAHAARKSRGQSAIEYAQGDLLELGSVLESTGRRFDLIEAVGVLHHLADPYAGWRVLLSLLKPGGFMLVGLYSAPARRNLAALRAGLASGKYGTAADDVRRARHDLMQSDNLAIVATHPDFFSISTCRDLLFHVQEQALPLGEIDDFLRGNGLAFLGFSLEETALSAYRRHYPQDPGATDLDLWQEFESGNPDCFSGMYQFWLQKAL
jgi:tetratricopeptide (TPR) repeat protein/SAM-dependent methyltransferase